VSSEVQRARATLFTGTSCTAAASRVTLSFGVGYAQPTYIPELQRFVQAATNESFPVRGERDTEHTVSVPLQPLNEDTRRHVPYPDESVSTAGSNELTIGGDGDRGNSSVVVERVEVINDQDLSYVRLPYCKRPWE
jgi:hypothetical protein